MVLAHHIHVNVKFTNFVVLKFGTLIDLYNNVIDYIANLNETNISNKEI